MLGCVVNKALAKPFLVLFLGLAYAQISLADCPGTAVLEMARRPDSIEADFAAAVFKFGDGTAYYVGGFPGYLITANHVLEAIERSKSKLSVCSPFLGEADADVCFEVEGVSKQLAEFDLALLALKEPFPNPPRPIEFSPARATNTNTYRILGYPIHSEMVSRTWSVSVGTLQFEATINARSLPGPISNKRLYQMNIPQYGGSSGAPVMDERGNSVATAIRSRDSSSQAYAVPHADPVVVSWFLSNTRPSAYAAGLISEISAAGISGQTVSKITRALDVRNRRLTYLDILHIASSQSPQVYQTALFSCSFLLAGTPGIEWTYVTKLSMQVAIKIAAILSAPSTIGGEGGVAVASADYLASAGRYLTFAADLIPDSYGGDLKPRDAWNALSDPADRAADKILRYVAREGPNASLHDRYLRDSTTLAVQQIQQAHTRFEYDIVPSDGGASVFISEGRKVMERDVEPETR